MGFVRQNDCISGKNYCLSVSLSVNGGLSSTTSITASLWRFSELINIKKLAQSKLNSFIIHISIYHYYNFRWLLDWGLSPQVIVASMKANSLSVLLINESPVPCTLLGSQKVSITICWKTHCYLMWQRQWWQWVAFIACGAEEFTDITWAGGHLSRSHLPIMSVSEALDLDPSAVVLGTDLHDILKDQSHAPQGGDVGQRGEDGQHPEVLDKHQQDQEGQNCQHVEANVHIGGQHQDLPGFAGFGGHVDFFHHLMWSTMKGSIIIAATLTKETQLSFNFR